MFFSLTIRVLRTDPVLVKKVTDQPLVRQSSLGSTLQAGGDFSHALGLPDDFSLLEKRGNRGVCQGPAAGVAPDGGFLVGTGETVALIVRFRPDGAVKLRG